MKKLLRVKFNMLVLCVVVAVMVLSACRGASGGSDEDYRSPIEQPKTTPEPEKDDDDDPTPIPVAAFVKVEGQGKVATFWMSNHEVTQEEWAKIADYESLAAEYGNTVYNINAAPSFFKDNPAKGETQVNRPVETVTWYDVVYYCNLRTQAENGGKTAQCVYKIDVKDVKDGHITDATVTLVDGWETKTGYRLPTVDEWVLAAGNLPTNVGDYAWYKANAGSKTHEVMKGKLSSKDLYNMFGNVCEWCWNAKGGNLNGNKYYRAICGGMYGYAATVAINYYDPALSLMNGLCGFRICSSFEPKTK